MNSECEGSVTRSIAFGAESSLNPEPSPGNGKWEPQLIGFRLEDPSADASFFNIPCHFCLAKGILSQTCCCKVRALAHFESVAEIL